MKLSIKLILLSTIKAAFISQFVLAQNPYYDAVKLKKLINNNANGWPENSKDSVSQILANYCRKDEVSTIFFSKNPFIKQYASTIANRSALNGAQNAFSYLYSSVGGLDVTNIADGIAKFLIKRGKQELGITFFNRFKETINTNKDLKTLFPNTADLLDAIDVEIYNYNAYIQSLREAFKKDIKALPKNFPGIVDNNTYYFEKHKELKAELLSACYLANEIENQSHPGDILENFPDSLLNQFTKDSTKHYLKGAVQTVQLISSSLRDTSSADNAPYWVNIGKIRQLVNDPIAFKIYLGLLYQQAINNYEDIKFDNSNSLKTFLNTVAANDQNIKEYKKYILGYGSRIDALNNLISQSKTTTTIADTAAIAQYAKYFKAVVELIEYSTLSGDLPVGSNNNTIAKILKVDFHKEFKPFFDISYKVTDMATDISSKNYSGVINDAVFIYSEINSKPVANKDSTQKNINNFVKYASFMATIVTAKNSDEVESAIEAAALPAGSYSVKQKSIWNISLNGYIGYGFDLNGFFSKGLYASGIYAPIGFSNSWGLSKKYGGAITVFASFIDVGSLASYRLTKGNTDTLKQQVRLESIISPSAQLFFEIPGTPIAIGGGWRLAPKLFYSNNSGFTSVPSRSVFNLTALVDIPILTLHNKPR